MTQTMTQTQPDAIEHVVCKPIEELRRFPMDIKTSATFIQLCMLPKDFSIPEKEKPFLCAVIEKRLEQCFSFKITDMRLILALALIAETPGSAIMYLWYLQYWCKQNNVRTISLDQFSTLVFPMGFPSKDDLHKVWIAQKVAGENASYNLVDDGRSGLSVQFFDNQHIFSSI